MVAVRQFQVTVDCALPERVALFWCEALGYVIPPPPEGFADWAEFERALPAESRVAVACVDPTGVGPRLFFQRVPKASRQESGASRRRVGTGLVGAERLAALEAECERLVERGATRVRLSPGGDGEESCFVMQDVEGNEFCLD